MEPHTGLKTKDYYRLIVPCGIIILLASLEILAKAKDLEYFNYVNQSLQEAGNPNITYGDFVVSLMAAYVSRILVPVGLGLNSYYAYSKSGITRIFIWSWGIFTFAALAFHVLTLELSSMFYYALIILYIVLLLFLISLSDRIAAKRRGL